MPPLYPLDTSDKALDAIWNEGHEGGEVHAMGRDNTGDPASLEHVLNNPDRIEDDIFHGTFVLLSGYFDNGPTD